MRKLTVPENRKLLPMQREMNKAIATYLKHWGEEGAHDILKMTATHAERIADGYLDGRSPWGKVPRLGTPAEHVKGLRLSAKSWRTISDLIDDMQDELSYLARLLWRR
jgi:hypothetical protein